MEEKIMLYTKDCEDAQKNVYCLKYFLLADTMNCDTVYGIEIEKNWQGGTERESVRGLCTEKKEVEKFLWKLWDGTAFPVELEVLCDDFITEREAIIY